MGVAVDEGVCHLVDRRESPPLLRADLLQNVKRRLLQCGDEKVVEAVAV